MSKRVEVILGKDGSVKVEAFGFKGASCEEATAFLDRIFGGDVEREHKASYYEEEVKLCDGLPNGYCG